MPGVVLMGFPPYGHMRPATLLAAELARRGVGVRVYGSERSRAAVEAAGARFCPYPAPYEAFDPTPATPGLFHDMARLARLSETILPALLAELRADPPELLLMDTKALWARLAGQILGCPCATESVVFAIRPGLIPVPALVGQLYGGRGQDGVREGLAAFQEYRVVASRLARRFGVECPDIIGFLGNPQPLNLIFTAREFQLSGEAFGPEYEFVGPLLSPAVADASFPWDQLGSAWRGHEQSGPPLPPIEARPQATTGSGQAKSGEPLRRPLVYISLGTTFFQAREFYQACFAAFAGHPAQFVLACGSMARELENVPANFLVFEKVPQMELLTRADAFITHGGMNSIQEGLAHGLPLVVVPQRGDQYLVARRTEELGAGLALTPAEITPERLRVKLDELLDTAGFRQRAQALGARLRAAGGVSRAADLVQMRMEESTARAVKTSTARAGR